MIKRLAYISISCVMALTVGSVYVHADDTEIFFGGPTPSNPIRPNVLLILDTSGSMTALVPNSGGKSRIQVMKESLVDVIQGMEEVNVGLMRFTYTQGGAVLFPIRYIDEPAALTVSEPDDLTPTFSYTIDAGDNDAEEDVATGVMTVADPVLEIAQVPGGATTITQRVAASSDDADQLGITPNLTGAFWTDGAHDGARFSGLAIPAGATIVTAKFRLWPNANPGSGGTTELAGHDVDNSPTFTTGANDITTRTKTTAQVLWNFADTTPEERDVTGIVQEIVDRPGWAPGQALSIISFNGTVGRNFHSFDTNATLAPELEVNFTTGVAPADQLVGLRFSSVDIPQGATVKSAKLILTSTSTVSGSPPGANWGISAEKVANSVPFTSAPFDISSRPRTGVEVDVSVPDTVTDTPFETPDLSAVVQEIVDQAGASGWCGGNAMTFIIEREGPNASRYFHTVEGNLSLAAKLEVSYDATTATGCFRKTETAQVSSKYDDAEEQSNGNMQRTSGDLDVAQKLVGLRFVGVDVPKDATILSAFIDLRSDGISTAGNPTVTIDGHASENSLQFTGSPNDISSRPKTTPASQVSWTTGDWTADNQVQTTPDLKNIVQEIVNDPDWGSSNAMSFIFGFGANNRPAESFDGNPNQAPVLRITFESAGAAGGVKTVRERLIELVNSLPASDWTPIVENFYEAAHYWRGESIVYGTNRNGQRRTRISHPGTYCDDELGNCNGADVNNASIPTDKYGVSTPSACPLSNLDDSNCINRRIRGNPNYISPFQTELTCVNNYQVLLTDGEANRNELTGTIRNEYLGGGTCRGNKSDGSAVTPGERCGIDLVEFLKNEDQSASLANDQTVTTYTIGFNTTSLANATQFLTDVADVGGGSFFEAETATDLTSVFTQILTEVKDDPTAFVAPTIATNQFNQLLSRDLLYFGMFTPDLDQGWLGNVKKYQLCLVPDPDGDGTDNCTFADTLDQTGASALDPATNQFLTTAQSFWSAIQDGSETTLGGTGAELTDFNTRIIYTETTSTGIEPPAGTSLGTAGFQYGDGTSVTTGSTAWNDPSLDPMRDLVCPDSTDLSPGSDCENRMLWLAGKVMDAESTDTSATTRWATNDVLHSSPGVITYGGEDTDADGIVDTFYDRVLYGTNDGGLHMLNADTGKEEWVFFPQDLLDAQRTLFDDSEGDHLYGLDTPVVLRIVDNNNDGQIDPTVLDAQGNPELVHAYIGNRRGGNFYYALDITPTAKLTNNTTPIVPKFLWRIEGGTGDFVRLGDTWAEPRLATIRVNGGAIKDVLVISGGYTNALDDATKFGTDATGGADNLGNAIFLVDPDDGSKIISFSGSGTGADVEVPAMKYSMVAAPTVFDSDGDGFDDRLYVPDTGGQLFRVDLGTDIQDAGGFHPTTGTSTVVGLLASVSDHSTSPAVPADQRRFYHRASVVQVRDTEFSDAANGEFDYVLVGSGYRAHPLNTDANDRLYAFRDRLLGRMADVSPKDHIADTYPLRTTDASSPLFGLTTPISHTASGDLIDVTTTILDSSSVNKQSTGWFFDFASDPTANTGEKILSSPRVIAGTVFVTSFQPQAAAGSDPCSADIGSSRLFNFNVLSAGAAIDWDEDGTLEDVADRSKSGGLGLMSEGVSVYTQEGVLIVHTSGAGLTAELATPGAPRFRTFWADDV